MQDIGILPANLTGIVLESCFYGAFVLLFISNAYFLAARDSQKTRRNFASLMFLGAAGLALVVTVHWIIVIYQAFFAFTYLDTKVAETTFYLDATHWTEIIKQTCLLLSIIMGDSFVIYRLWIFWGKNRYIVIFPIGSLVAVFILGTLYVVSMWEPKLGGATTYTQPTFWVGASFGLSFLTTIYGTGLIVFRIVRTSTRTVGESPLMALLEVLVESAALQTFWLTFVAIADFAGSYAGLIASDTLPVVIGISNLLIHTRVGLGWSRTSSTSQRSVSTGKISTPTFTSDSNRQDSQV
ncbi:hypothetical protein C8F04DRAFT_1273161 [Mycena alexandri]|uniref:Uncharacterized protein n=1 Tax=Mycena alexandri TaxID=1745969 RepID=A0AAD6S8V7_9AGAR|nr:hypothetical protein C8F04DRAFT_1273161 [Mycena alexandri]